MHFEARDLKPYAEPVLAGNLKAGSVYFSITFVDDEMHIPAMETLVFVGKNLEENDSARVYFQDIDSYREGIRYESATEDDHATFFECADNELNNVFEYEQALDVLMRCLLKRKGSLETG